MTQLDQSRPSLTPIRRILGVITALILGVGLVGASPLAASAAGTGVIAGTVTGAAGVPLQGVNIQLFYCDEDYDPQTQLDCWTLLPGATPTAANGTYSIGNLDAGLYRASIFPQANNSQYAYEYWDGARTVETATDITVTDGVTTTVNPTLDLGATISGTVLGDNGLPGDDLIVSATNTATPNSSQTALVQADGSYSFSGLAPGEYYLWAGPNYGSTSTLVREYYDNKPDAASATRFTVGSGATYTANFELETGGIISGTVTNSSSAPLADIDVTVFEEDDFGYWRQVKTATTNASGLYTVEGLENGAYVVRFSDFGGTYAQRYNGGAVDRSAATLLNVGPGANATAVNAQLVAGGSISGTVTQTPTGGTATPSNGAYVSIIKVSGGEHEAVESVQTSASGTYSLSGLAPGNYTIQTFGDNSANWAWTYLGQVYYPEEATTVAVSAGATANAGTTNVLPGTTISGYFTDTSFAPVPSVQVHILYERTPGNWVTPPPSGGAGDINFYRVGGLPPGKYKVRFQDTATTGTPYVTQYWDNKPTLETATVIDASNGGTFDNITARMTTTPTQVLPEPERIEGPDRWAVSANISQESYPDGADVVYISSGNVFPDALSAGPAAARDGAPLLLVSATAVAPSVVSEIQRLDPSKIVVIGGEASVSPAVYTQLAGLADSIERVAGATRYEVSREIAERSFSATGVETAYVATGANFPDALAGGGAAGITGAPVILVNGSATTLDAATATLLDELGVEEIKVLGGPNSVSAGVFEDLGDIAPTVRLSGADRFTAAIAINEDAFAGGANTVFLATGSNFPDALAGSAWAAKQPAPLYVVRPNCVPQAVLNSISSLAPTNIVLLGGPATLTPAVEDLTPCA
ncbi:putative cell wall-binding protein [Microbacteriaceae bacterium SG_E_30_P1]|uniref:alpha-amylase n=1 Tax=Antiquaquibacter oligotrophicus TaxID=2880260 RepID=A0ABT6KK24_9MICO|nr:cell wall-binding repeat-containing protein [Antiquaquibacter oligotrophicus]MDH6180305.1 putative cell wall-binding protein [Antiquaquibacter oligotrophicus]UDF13948.1 cell wall-binding repeat-containing protein [Antiquaquibacter oligotrophicus]